MDDVPNIRNRVKALESLKARPDFEPLAVGFKRVVNIIKKSGQMDALRNQIVERKVVELIVDKAKLTEEEVKPEEQESEFAVYHSVLAAKNDEAIPEAKYEDNTPPGQEPEKEREPED